MQLSFKSDGRKKRVSSKKIFIVVFKIFLMYLPLVIFFFLLKIFLMFLFIFEREREIKHKHGRGRERGRYKIWSRLQALSCQHRAQCGDWTPEPRDHDLSWGPTFNQLRHSGAPPLLIFFISCYGFELLFSVFNVILSDSF